MTLQDEATYELNEFFKSKDYPLKVTKIIFYRPAYLESYWDNYEPITDINRLFLCNTVRLNIEIMINGRDCEFDIKFKNDNEDLICQYCNIKYWDHFKNEDFEKVAESMMGILTPRAEKDFPYVFKNMLKKRG